MPICIGATHQLEPHSIHVWHTSVAASLGPDLASRATSSNNDDVDATSVDGVVASSVVGVDLRLIHCGRILAKLDALSSVQSRQR